MNLKHLSFGSQNLFCKHLHRNIPAQMRVRYFWVMASVGLATSLPLSVAVSASPQALAPNQQIAQNSEQAPSSLQMTQLFVNPSYGNDSTGNGSDRTPFKTITQALRVAQPNTVIFLAPGIYSTESGETFPLQLKSGVTIQGDPPNKGKNVIIRGGGLFLSPTFARQNIAILGADKSAMAGVTVTNPNGRGYGLWIESSSPIVADNTFIGNTHDGISVTGNGAPLIRNNYFANNGANGITIFNNARPEVRANIFEKTGFGINVAQNAAPLLINNRIIQNVDGVVVQGKAQPILRNNTIERNTRDGLVAITLARPDLGTSGQPGGNIFRNNGRFEINSSAAVQIIPAFGNQIARGRTAGRLDLAGNLIPNTQNSIPVNTREVQSTPTVVSSFPDLPQRRSTNIPVSSNGVAASSSSPQITGVEIPVLPARNNISTETSSSVTSGTSTTTSIIRVRRGEDANVRVRPVPPANNQTDPVVISPPLSAPRNVIPPLTLGPEKQDETQVNLNTELPTRQVRNILPSSAVEPGLLPVPGSEIPTGNTGNVVSLPTVDVSQRNPRRGSTIVNNRSSVSSRANDLSSRLRLALGMRYRVVVDVDSPRELRLVRSLVPKAFRTRSNGRMVIQVGAYSDRGQAEDMLQRMTSNGLNASLEDL